LKENKLKILLAFLLFILLPFLIYANSLHNEFVFDDIALIVENPMISTLENISYLLGVYTSDPSYRPMRFISYAIDYYFWGLNPVGYHISNILFHIITSFLVFGLVFHLAGSYWCAVFSALFFSLNPVQTDSVAYLAGRRDILCALFYLAGFYCFLRYRAYPKVAAYLILSFFFYLLTLSSKEMGVTLPLLFFVYDFVEVTSQEKKVWRGFREVWSRYYRLYIPFLIAGAGYTYYKLFINYPSTHHGYHGGSIVNHALTVAKILAYYLKIIFVPVVLSADYSYNAFPLPKAIYEAGTFFSLIILAGVFFLIARLITRAKVIAFGLLWFFITILPVSQIFPHHELLAEHYLYLPLVGISLVVGSVAGEVMKGYRFRRMALGLYLIILLTFGIRVVDRNRDWKDGLTLWSKTVRTVPECVRARNNLGVELFNQGRYQEALVQYKRALGINPWLPEIMSNLGSVYASLKDYDQAIRWYQTALKRNPQNPKIYINLGRIYWDLGRKEEAYDLYYAAFQVKEDPAEGALLIGNYLNKKEHYQGAVKMLKKALIFKPHSAEAHNNLGVAYNGLGLYEKAAEEIREAIRLSPASAEAHNNLGVAYNGLGLYEKAAEEIREAIRLNPASAEAHNNLGMAYSGLASFSQAIEEYQKSTVLNPKFARPHYNLANIYKKKGMLDKAIGEYQEALKREPGLYQAHNNLGIIYEQMGDYYKSIREFETALSIRPDYLSPYLGLASIYLDKVVDREMALRCLEKAEKLNPPAPQAEAIRRKIRELKG
jgi:tetratricopeptide (TPR) repeat protein